MRHLLKRMLPMTTARPRNQLYLDQEVARIWRSLTAVRESRISRRRSWRRFRKIRFSEGRAVMRHLLRVLVDPIQRETVVSTRNGRPAAFRTLLFSY